MSKERDQEWLKKALLCYEQEKSKNPEYLSFDDITIKTFARRIVGQIKEQMKLDNEQCELPVSYTHLTLPTIRLV